MNKRFIYSISPLLIVIFVSCLFLMAMGESPSSGDLIHLRTGTINTSQKAPDTSVALKSMGLSRVDQGYYIIQFTGPIKEKWKSKVKELGGKFFDYLPNNAFIVKMDGNIRDTVKSLREIKWVGFYQPDYKVDPQLAAKAEGMEEWITLTVQTFEAQDIAEVRNRLQELGAEILASSGNDWGGTIRVNIVSSLIPQIINLPSIKWVEQYIPPKLFNEQAVTPGEMNVTGVWTNGLTGTGQIIAVADTGLDIGVNDATLHPDFQGAVVATYGLGTGRGGDWSDQHGHGTHVSGSVLGRGTGSGGTYRGVAYDAQLVFQSILDEDGFLLQGVASLGDLFLPPYNDGARIHSNSWGSPVFGGYTAESQAVDQFMWGHRDMVVIFAAGNEGIDSDSDGVIDLDSMAAPATAKNVLTVGANENDRNVAPFTTYTWSGWGYTSPPFNGDPTTDNPPGMAAFSSRGPCDDGRIKPDVVAPGTFVASTRSRNHAFNDMMNATPNLLWTSAAPWNYIPHGPDYKWSTEGNDPGVEASLVVANPLDLRMGGDTLFFSTTYNLGGDSAYIEISDDNFSSGIQMGPLTGSSGGWADVQAYFGLFLLFFPNPDQIKLRFRLVSGGGAHGTGWEIHRVRIYSSGWARMPEVGIGADWDTTDENYLFMGGTSMATPLTAGAAALVRQYYVDNEGITPSAALVKATLLSGATDMSPGQYGTGATQEIPSPPRPNNVEGWGRVNLENAIFPTAPRVLEYLDETAGLSTRWRRTLTFQNNSAANLTVTIAWTDYPSTPTAAINLVNDLDLTVTDPSSTIYYPNGLTTSDRRNNVEIIDLSSPSTGEYTITIYGHNIPNGPQAFALVVCGDIANLMDQGNEVIPYTLQPGNFGRTDDSPDSPCFIATAAYGSPYGDNVDLLRVFRDRYLMAHSVGRKWVSLYYRYSPRMAGLIGNHPAMKRGVRVILFPFVAISAGMIQTTTFQKGLIFCFIMGFPLGMALLCKWRKANKRVSFNPLVPGR
ncbi:MAG: S8 family serine peptidase [Proteobacteria bacterium]|nr:S8 family serine peptidase [Pseudomonadota bacterium]